MIYTLAYPKHTFPEKTTIVSAKDLNSAISTQTKLVCNLYRTPAIYVSLLDSSIKEQSKMVKLSKSLSILTLKLEGAAKIETREEFGFKNLSPEIITIIFGFLPLKALKQASQVSKRWLQISNDPRLWLNSHIVINFRRIYTLNEILTCQKKV